MSSNFIAALVAFLGGSVISVVNAVITAKQINSETHSISGNTPIIRQVLSFAYLAGVFLVVRKLPIDPFWPLIGAAVGLTVPSILFTLTIVKHMKGDD